VTSSQNEIRDAILDAINEDKEIFVLLNSIPEKIERTVEEFTPVLTGETRKSISVKSRRTALKKLSTRRVTLGTVYSDDDPQRVAAIEYGRGESDEHGGTPEFAMFRKAAAQWDGAEII
jgi:hypothetical protein